jgi:hypothetical protein
VGPLAVPEVFGMTQPSNAVSIVFGDKPDRPSHRLVWIAPRLLAIALLMLTAALATTVIAESLWLETFHTSLLGVVLGVLLVDPFGRGLV